VNFGDHKEARFSDTMMDERFQANHYYKGAKYVLHIISDDVLSIIVACRTT
jgi:hypothetical protein